MFLQKMPLFFGRGENPRWPTLDLTSFISQELFIRLTSLNKTRQNAAARLHHIIICHNNNNVAANIIIRPMTNI